MHHEMERDQHDSRNRNVTWTKIHDRHGSGHHYGAQYAFNDPFFHEGGLMINTAAATAAAAASSSSQPPLVRQRWADEHQQQQDYDDLHSQWTFDDDGRWEPRW